MYSTDRSITSTLRTANVALLAILSIASSSMGQHIKVVTEYRYPTTFTVTPVTRLTPQGNTIITGGIVAPSDFETREVGTLMTVWASVADLASNTTGIPTLEQRHLHGNTDLMVASATGYVDSVRRMLSRGAPVNARNHAGSTALMGAAAGGYQDIVTLLLQRRANVNARSRKGASALMFAAKNGHDSIVKRLLKSGARVDLTDKSGATALMYAVAEQHDSTARLLLKNGANARVRDRRKTTPFMLASATEDSEIMVLLTRAGRRR